MSFLDRLAATDDGHGIEDASSTPPMPKERKLFKDQFDSNAALLLARQITFAWPAFPAKSFVKLATADLNDLEFHGRIRQFSTALRAALPPDIPEALEILTRSLPPPLKTTSWISEGWRQWPIGQFIADYGLPHFEESMQAMIDLTQRFTSEFALRPFIEAQPDRVLPRLLDLTRHHNAHVRRWCSEGTRPRLPWGKRLDAFIADPSATLPILQALRDDSDEYVLRSVGNHLNDIAKDHPDLVIHLCQSWLQESPSSRHRLVRRSLRTLVKKGHPCALKTLGVSPAKAIRATLVLTPTKVTIGESITCTATIHNHSKRERRLLIDYIITFAPRDGRSRRKVFKWTGKNLAAGQTITLAKKHALRPATTRTLHPGIHSIALQINGGEFAHTAFCLEVSPRERGISGRAVEGQMRNNFPQAESASNGKWRR